MRKLLLALLLLGASLARADVLNVPFNAAAPPAIGSTTPNTGAFTTLSATGKISGAASTTSAASLNLPQGSAPTVPSNGDLWTTSAGVFAYINGSTVGPFGSGGGGGSGTVNNGPQYCVAYYATTGTAVSCSPYLTINGANLEIGANGSPGTLTYWGVNVGQNTTVYASTYGGATAFYWPYAPGGVLAIDPTLATGDTVYRNSAGVATRLPIGANGQCKVVTGGVPAWGACPVNIVSGTSTVSGNSAATQLWASSSSGVLYPVTIGTNLSITGTGPFTLNASGGGGGTVAWNWHVGGILTYSSTTSFNVSNGQFADTTNAVYIQPSALTGWAAGTSGCGGLDVGSSLLASAWYNVFAISQSGNSSPCYIASVGMGPLTVSASSGAPSTSSPNITLSANCPSWVVPGMTVYDSTNAIGNAVLGTVASCTGGAATLVLNANSAYNGATSDALRIIANPATGPTMPSGYSGGYFRLVGSLRTNGSSQFLSFTQIGPKVEWAASVNELNNFATAAQNTLYLMASAPPGYRSRFITIVDTGAAAGSMSVFNGDSAGYVAGNQLNAPGADGNYNGGAGMRFADIYTDLYARIRISVLTTGNQLNVYSRGFMYDWSLY